MDIEKKKRIIMISVISVIILLLLIFTIYLVTSMIIRNNVNKSTDDIYNKKLKCYFR